MTLEYGVVQFPTVLLSRARENGRLMIWNDGRPFWFMVSMHAERNREWTLHEPEGLEQFMQANFLIGRKDFPMKLNLKRYFGTLTAPDSSLRPSKSFPSNSNCFAN